MSIGDFGGGITCAVCGARFETVAESMDHPHMTDVEGPTPAEIAQFEKIWDAEHEVKSAQASEFFNVGRVRLTNDPAKLAEDTTKRKAKLFALVGALTPQLAKAYGTWRTQRLADLAE